MNFLFKILLTAIAVVVLANVLPGVEVNGYISAIIVAIVLGILNFIVRPILVILTLPITVFTLGLFLLVINACMIMLADYFVDGFGVTSIWYALLFSLCLSIAQSILYSFLKEGKKSK